MNPKIINTILIGSLGLLVSNQILCGTIADNIAEAFFPNSSGKMQVVNDLQKNEKQYGVYIGQVTEANPEDQRTSEQYGLDEATPAASIANGKKSVTGTLQSGWYVGEEYEQKIWFMLGLIDSKGEKKEYKCDEFGSCEPELPDGLKVKGTGTPQYKTSGTKYYKIYPNFTVTVSK